MAATRGLRIGVALAAALAAIGALAVSVASAATIEVTTDAESGPGSLEEAIVNSEPGDTIVIPPGTYLLTNGEVLEAKDLTLQGAGEEETTVVPSGGGAAFDDTGVNTVDLTEGPPLNPDAEDDGLESKAQIIAIAVTVALLLLVLELVRRRRLVERYALLWMSAAVALLVLAIWTNGLEVIADAMGIAEPANAIFILAFGVAFFLLLHFSVATSRLAEETKILAQEVARLDQELRDERGDPNSAHTADQ